MIEFSRVNLANKILGCVGLWSDRSRESADSRLELIACVKKRYLTAATVNEFV